LPWKIITSLGLLSDRFAIASAERAIGAQGQRPTVGEREVLSWAGGISGH